MKIARLSILVVLVLLLLAAGCTSARPNTLQATSYPAGGTPGTRLPTTPSLPLNTTGVQTPLVSDLGSLLDRLRTSGASVGQPASLPDSPFSAPGFVVRINGGEVQVFEYPGDDAALADATRLAPDGTALDGKALNWPATPHVFYKGRLLIVYPGTDTAVLNPLEFVLGRQIAGPGQIQPLARATATPAAVTKVLTGTVAPAKGTGTPAAQAACTDKAAWVTDVTVPDGANIPAGQTFLKIWRVRNTGTCSWTPDYALVYAGGPTMGGQPALPISTTVKPGATVDLSTTLTAPAANGTYRARYQLRNPNGKTFGIDNSSDHTFWVEIVVRPGSTERISMPAGGSSVTLQPMLAAGTPRTYLLRLAAGQRLLLQAGDTLAVTLQGPDGQSVPLNKTPGKWAWDGVVPAAGDYTLVLRGNGPASLQVTIPPASPGAPAAPGPAQATVPAAAGTQRVILPPGATSAALSFTLTPGATRNYVIAGQAGGLLRLYLAARGSTFSVTGPDGLPVPPTNLSGDGRVGEFALPSQGDYTISLQGANNTLTIEMPRG